MFDDISKIADNLAETSWELNKRWGRNNPEIEYETDERNELKCLALYDDGWEPDGFDYVPESYDIITFWKKASEKQEIRLTFRQQRRWIRKIQERKRAEKRRKRDDNK